MINIVTIGGGTGSYVTLSGLKNISNVSLSAIVSMSDNGGSTGVLRDELGVLPPGDIRQCLVALSDHSDIVRNLMSYRFTEGTLTGHNFGNIFIAALEKVTGDFVKGIEIASEILKVKGKVIPITRDNADLSILLSNGEVLEGQVNITNTNLQELGLKKIFYKKNVQINENAESAIKQADYIIIGPGDYYGSVIPNLIVDGFKEALTESKAKLIFPINLTNKNGHTLHWKASDYLKDMESRLSRPVDIILVNNEAPSNEQIERYKLQEGDGVLVKDDLKDDRVVRKVLISHLIPSTNSVDTVKRSFIRHDSFKIANCISDLIGEGKIKIIFDFDDVLFHATKLFKEYIYKCLEKNGIAKDIAEDYYKKMEREFSLKDFISELLAQEKINKISCDEIYEEIMSKCKDFVNIELLEIVKKLGKYNCYIVSKGDEGFQRDKIGRSGIESFFSEINIVSGTKKDAVEKICNENKDSQIIFTDDKVKFFEDIDMKKCNNLKTILFDKNGLENLISEINKN